MDFPVIMDVLKCVGLGCGAQCVMTCGIGMMLELYANNCKFHSQVSPFKWPFPQLILFSVDAYVGQFGPGFGPIFLDNVRCTGNESYLFNCTGLLVDNCNHQEDAGVFCINQPEPGERRRGEVGGVQIASSFVSFIECTENDVRLVDGRNKTEGRVEVCKEGLWGTICDDNWDMFNSLVVCRQVGINASSKFSTIIFHNPPIISHPK